MKFPFPLFLLLVVACSDPAAPVPDPGMAPVDSPSEALKAPGAPNSQPIVPSACQIPDHANSPACVEALENLGISATYLWESCGSKRWAACVRSAVASTRAVWVYVNGLDQHGHAGAPPSFDYNGLGGCRQDEFGCRQYGPSGGYDAWGHPLGGYDNFSPWLPPETR